MILQQLKASHCFKGEIFGFRCKWSRKTTAMKMLIEFQTNFWQRIAAGLDVATQADLVKKTLAI
jgi:hypothetical protein